MVSGAAEITLGIALIPLVAAVIGYGTNWVGIKLLFHPVEFRGVRVPAARVWLQFLPRRLTSLPGLAHAGIGWQGIIPSRAGKIASMTYDSGMSHFAAPGELLGELDREALVAELSGAMEPLVGELVERAGRGAYPDLWERLPASVRTTAQARITARAPQVAHRALDRLERSFDQVVDPKLMLIRMMSSEPILASKLSKAIGERDLTFVIRLGFLFGGVFGVVQAALWLGLEAWWLFPTGGLIVGTVTNWLALKLLFVPLDPRRIGPLTIQGSFMRRQPQVAEEYARIIAEDLLMPRTIAAELLGGPRSDRFHRLLRESVEEALTESLGPPARVAKLISRGRYDELVERAARHGAAEIPAMLEREQLETLVDTQRKRIRGVVAERLRRLDRDRYAGLIMPLIEEEAWLVYLMGGVLGFCVGCLQLLALV